MQVGFVAAFLFVFLRCFLHGCFVSSNTQLSNLTERGTCSWNNSFFFYLSSFVLSLFFFFLVQGSIIAMGSDEQREELFRSQKNGILGCFAFTEIGAGVLSGAGVETTAHYDEKTKSFIIHSPTLTSTLSIVFVDFLILSLHSLLHSLPAAAFHILFLFYSSTGTENIYLQNWLQLFSFFC